MTRGKFHKDLVGGAVLPIIVQAKALKAQQKTSLQVAEILEMPLEKVNGFWGRI